MSGPTYTPDWDKAAATHEGWVQELVAFLKHHSWQTDMQEEVDKLISMNEEHLHELEQEVS